VFSSPAVSGNTVYFGTNSGTLEALNAATGAVQCVFTVPTAQPAGTAAHIFSSPVVGDVDGTGPVVFFGDPGVSSASQSYIAGHFWAVTGVGNTGGNCQEKWAYDNWVNKGKSTAETGVWGEPALVKQGNGTWAVVFGTSNPDNSVYALNAVTGARLWHFRALTRGPDEDVGAGPTISPPGDNGFADGVVYVDGKDGIEYALNLLTGEQIWSFTLGPGSQHSYGVAEAALTGITLITCYAGSVFALNAITGAELWEVTLGGTIEASPAVAGGTGNQVLFIGDLNKDEYGLSLQDGSQVFSASVTGNLEASAAVANGMLYFTSGSTLYAYAPPSARRDALRG
jgi:outer membrane protein assembly factor BamB